jgi:prepilin-type N-terminal cleavage/methylation domain-containing protein
MAIAMHHKQYNNRGITLPELLIATFIVGIIMLGVVSADYAIQKFYADSSKGAVSGFKTIALINHISAVARNAQGSFTNPSNRGILIDTSIVGGGDLVALNTLCIRFAENGPNNWQCYSRLTAADTFNYLYTCLKSNAAICATTDEQLARVNTIEASFTSNTNENTQRCLFTLTLKVPETDTTTKTYLTSITPTNHRL